MSATWLDIVCIAIEALDDIMAVGSEQPRTGGNVHREQFERVQNIAREARSKMGDRALGVIKGMKP